jgi:hypothetical protein
MMARLGENKIKCSRCGGERIALHMYRAEDGSFRLCPQCIEDLHNLERQSDGHATSDLLAAAEAGLEALTVSSPECEASTIAAARKRRDAKRLLRTAIAKAKGVA